MKKKDKILLAVLFVLMVVVLMVVLGIMPNKKKIKINKQNTLEAQASLDGINAKIQQANASLRKLNKDKKDLDSENNRLDKQYKDEYTDSNGQDRFPYKTEDEALKIINDKLLKYGLPQLDPKSKHYVQGDSKLLVMDVNLPEGVSGGGFTAGFVIDSDPNNVKKAKDLNFITSESSLGNIIKYIPSETLYYRIGKTGDFKAVKPNKLGGAEYKMRLISDELNKEGSQIRIKSFSLGSVKLVDSSVINKDNTTNSSAPGTENNGTPNNNGGNETGAAAAQPSGTNGNNGAATNNGSTTSESGVSTNEASATTNDGNKKQATKSYYFSNKQKPESDDEMVLMKKEIRTNISIVIEFVSQRNK